MKILRKKRSKEKNHFPIRRTTMKIKRKYTINKRGIYKQQNQSQNKINPNTNRIKLNEANIGFKESVESVVIFSSESSSISSGTSTSTAEASGDTLHTISNVPSLNSILAGIWCGKNVPKVNSEPELVHWLSKQNPRYIIAPDGFIPNSTVRQFIIQKPVMARRRFSSVVLQPDQLHRDLFARVREPTETGDSSTEPSCLKSQLEAAWMEEARRFMRDVMQAERQRLENLLSPIAEDQTHDASKSSRISSIAAESESAGTLAQKKQSRLTGLLRKKDMIVRQYRRKRRAESLPSMERLNLENNVGSDVRNDQESDMMPDTQFRSFYSELVSQIGSIGQVNQLIHDALAHDPIALNTLTRVLGSRATRTAFFRTLRMPPHAFGFLSDLFGSRAVLRKTLSKILDASVEDFDSLASKLDSGIAITNLVDIYKETRREATMIIQSFMPLSSSSSSIVDMLIDGKESEDTIAELINGVARDRTTFGSSQTQLGHLPKITPDTVKKIAESILTFDVKRLREIKTAKSTPATSTTSCMVETSTAETERTTEEESIYHESQDGFLQKAAELRQMLSANTLVKDTLKELRINSQPTSLEPSTAEYINLVNKGEFFSEVAVQRHSIHTRPADEKVIEHFSTLARKLRHVMTWSLVKDPVVRGDLSMGHLEDALLRGLRVTERAIEHVEGFMAGAAKSRNVAELVQRAVYGETDATQELTALLGKGKGAYLLTTVQEAQGQVADRLLRHCAIDSKVKATENMLRKLQAKLENEILKNLVSSWIRLVQNISKLAVNMGIAKSAHKTQSLLLSEDMEKVLQRFTEAQNQFQAALHDRPSGVGTLCTKDESATSSSSHSSSLNKPSTTTAITTASPTLPVGTKRKFLLRVGRDDTERPEKAEERELEGDGLEKDQQLEREQKPDEDLHDQPMEEQSDDGITWSTTSTTHTRQQKRLSIFADLFRLEEEKDELLPDDSSTEMPPIFRAKRRSGTFYDTHRVSLVGTRQRPTAESFEAVAKKLTGSRGKLGKRDSFSSQTTPLVSENSRKLQQIQQEIQDLNDLRVRGVTRHELKIILGRLKQQGLRLSSDEPVLPVDDDEVDDTASQESQLILASEGELDQTLEYMQNIFDRLFINSLIEQSKSKLERKPTSTGRRTALKPRRQIPFMRRGSTLFNDTVSSRARKSVRMTQEDMSELQSRFGEQRASSLSETPRISSYSSSSSSSISVSIGLISPEPSEDVGTIQKKHSLDLTTYTDVSQETLLLDEQTLKLQMFNAYLAENVHQFLKNIQQASLDPEKEMDETRDEVEDKFQVFRRQMVEQLNKATAGFPKEVIKHLSSAIDALINDLKDNSRVPPASSQVEQTELDEAAKLPPEMVESLSDAIKTIFKHRVDILLKSSKLDEEAKSLSPQGVKQAGKNLMVQIQHLATNLKNDLIQDPSTPAVICSIIYQELDKLSRKAQVQVKEQTQKLTRERKHEMHRAARAHAVDASPGKPFGSRPSVLIDDSTRRVHVPTKLHIRMSEGIGSKKSLDEPYESLTLISKVDTSGDPIHPVEIGLEDEEEKDELSRLLMNQLKHFTNYKEEDLKVMNQVFQALRTSDTKAPTVISEPVREQYIKAITGHSSEMIAKLTRYTNSEERVEVIKDTGALVSKTPIEEKTRATNKNEGFMRNSEEISSKEMMTITAGAMMNEPITSTMTVNKGPKTKTADEMRESATKTTKESMRKLSMESKKEILKSKILERPKDSLTRTPKATTMKQSRESMKEPSKTPWRDFTLETPKRSKLGLQKKSASESLKSTMLRGPRESTMKSLKVEQLKETSMEISKENVINKTKESTIETPKGKLKETTRGSLVSTPKENIVGLLRGSTLERLQETMLKDSATGSMIEKLEGTMMGLPRLSITETSKQTTLHLPKDSLLTGTVMEWPRDSITTASTDVSMKSSLERPSLFQNDKDGRKMSAFLNSIHAQLRSEDNSMVWAEERYRKICNSIETIATNLTLQNLPKLSMVLKEYKEQRSSISKESTFSAESADWWSGLRDPTETKSTTEFRSPSKTSLSESLYSMENLSDLAASADRSILQRNLEGSKTVPDDARFSVFVNQEMGISVEGISVNRVRQSSVQLPLLSATATTGDRRNSFSTELSLVEMTPLEAVQAYSHANTEIEQTSLPKLKGQLRETSTCLTKLDQIDIECSSVSSAPRVYARTSVEASPRSSETMSLPASHSKSSLPEVGSKSSSTQPTESDKTSTKESEQSVKLRYRHRPKQLPQISPMLPPGSRVITRPTWIPCHEWSRMLGPQARRVIRRGQTQQEQITLKRAELLHMASSTLQTRYDLMHVFRAATIAERSRAILTPIHGE